MKMKNLPILEEMIFEFYEAHRWIPLYDILYDIYGFNPI